MGKVSEKVFPAAILLMAVTVGFEYDMGSRVFILILGGFLALASYTDIRELKIPNKLNLAFSLIMMAVGLLLDFLGASGSFPRGLALGSISFTTFLALHLIHPRGLGMGDVKLAFGIGFSLGWFSASTLVSGVLASLLINGGISVILLIFSPKQVFSSRQTPSSKQVLPFAPALGAGSLLGLTNLF